MAATEFLLLFRDWCSSRPFFVRSLGKRKEVVAVVLGRQFGCGVTADLDRGEICFRNLPNLDVQYSTCTLVVVENPPHFVKFQSVPYLRSSLFKRTPVK